MPTGRATQRFEGPAHAFARRRAFTAAVIVIGAALLAIGGCGAPGDATTLASAGADSGDNGALDVDDANAGAIDGGALDGGAATTDGASDLDSADLNDAATPTEAPPAIVSVTPSEGPIGGMVGVEIVGHGLGEAIGVYFGESPGIDFLPIDGYSVRATAPPRPAGWVDVTVRLQDADGDVQDIVLPMAFRYVGKLSVYSVKPGFGDVTGGELVTVEGEGFDAQTRFIFGDRLAIAPLLIDEHSATMHTPPGVAGRVDVVAASPESVATAANAFEYRAKPRIDTVDPGVVGLNGGVVRLWGAGLVGNGAVITVFDGLDGALVKIAKIKGWDAAGGWIDVVAPAMSSAGPRGLRYTRPGAMFKLDNALSYVSFINPDTGKLQQDELVLVVPAVVPANLAAEVAIHIVGPIAALKSGAMVVRVGSVEVPVLSHDVGTWSGPQPGATIRVQVPPAANGTPGWQAVVVDIGEHSAWWTKGLMRSPAVATIAMVKPDRLAPQGGTPVAVHYGPVGVDFGPVIGVRIGGLFASNVLAGAKDVVDSATGDVWNVVNAVAPPGSPGPADVTVYFAKGQATLHGATQYAGAPSLAAILPATGAQAGGTLVRVIGGSVDLLKRVFFGQNEGKKLIAVHAGMALIRTPAGNPGAVSVEGWFGDGPDGAVWSKSVLPSAYTYFDPQAGNYGTWGGAVDGALNVTVMRSNLGVGPIEGALVVVQQDGKPQRTGITDARGQVTISEVDLHGPLMVSAAKQSHTAASLVAVDSRNATLRLRKFVAAPASPGDGGGEGEDDPLPYADGAIEGTVINADKYGALPVGTCDDTPQIGGNCAPCSGDLDCPGALTCESLYDPLAGFSMMASDVVDKGAAKACAAPCGFDAGCPTGYDCRATSLAPGAMRLRCVPTVGEPEVRCETSSPSLFGGNPAPGPKAKAASDGTFRIEARLGQVAVACFGGYLAKGTNTFVPLAMGLVRHVQVYTAVTTANLKLKLDTPMNRRLNLELRRLPMGPDTVGMERFVTGALDLGPEGYIRVVDATTTLVTDRLALERQPFFSGANTAIGWTFYAGISPVTGGSPTAIAIAEQLQPTATEHYARWIDGDTHPMASGSTAPNVRASASAGDLGFVVGDRGYIAVWSGNALTQQASPTARDLWTVWLDPLGSGVGWAGGERGTLLRRHPVLGWQASPAPMPVATSADPENSDRVVAITGSAPTDIWLLDGRNRIWHYDGVDWAAATSPAPLVTKPGQSWPPKPMIPRLRALRSLGDGSLVAVGDGGLLARALTGAGAGGAGAASLSWQSLPVARNDALHAVWGVGYDDFWIAGDRGALGKISITSGFGGSAGVTWLSSGTDESLFALHGDSGGVHVVGGAGVWLRVGLNGKVSGGAVADVSVDLRAVLPVADGAVALGDPVLRMGPYLELPYFDLPMVTSDLGDAIRWHTAGGVTPTLNMLRIAGYDYTTLWEIFLRGDVERVDLPDFQALGGFSPIPPGKLRLRLWRIYAPGLEIDHFNHKQLSIWQWVSYAFTTMITSQPLTFGLTPNAIDQPSAPPSPSPQAPKPPQPPSPK